LQGANLPPLVVTPFVSEEQRIIFTNVAPVGGQFFQLNLTGQPTPTPTAYDANPAVLVANIQATVNTLLGGPGFATVSAITDGVKIDYSVGALANRNVNQITAASINLTPLNPP